MGKILAGAPKSGPSAAELQAQQEAAAQRERDRIAAETAKKKMEDDQKAVADIQTQESKRRAFAGQLATEDDEKNRRKFLKGA
jgi:hypothetical protein